MDSSITRGGGAGTADALRGKERRRGMEVTTGVLIPLQTMMDFIVTLEPPMTTEIERSRDSRLLSAILIIYAPGNTQFGRRLPPEMQASSGRKMTATLGQTGYT